MAWFNHSQHKNMETKADLCLARNKARGGEMNDQSC